MVYPLATGTMYLTLSMAPGSYTKLEEAVQKRGRTMSDTCIPVCAVKLASGSKTTAREINILPSEKSQGLTAFKGWGIVPLVLLTNEEPRPRSEDLRKELFTFLRNVRGHNNVSKLASFYTDEIPAEWPTTEAKQIKPEELWPVFKSILGEENTATGRTIPQRISGMKYSQVGGYDTECLSPAIKGKYARELVRVANCALATNTWKAYKSVWKGIDQISKDTGVTISYPMNSEMVQAILAFYLLKGLKASTIRGYIASFKQAHNIKGLKCPALEDKFVDTIIKGAQNRESLVEKQPRGVVSVEILRQLWKNLKESNLPLDTKRTLWAIMTMLFMGSLRPTEALSAKAKEYDESKTLLWKDLKFMETRIDNKQVEFLQLRLRQPKTVRSLPEQIVEIPEVGSKLCAVKAMKKWIHSRKVKQDPNSPVFTLATGDLVTVSYLNKVLQAILPNESPKITARSFRPGLSTILAQQGADPESLKSLGRWTSKSYLTYIKKGRANNWRNTRKQLQQAIFKL